MVKTLYYLFKEIRPRQWTKNLIVFAPIFFTGQIFNVDLFQISIITFLSFCAASSSIYIINDLVDAPRDRLHPFKKTRPIASGKISAPIAVLTAFVLCVLAIGLSLSVSLSLLVVIFFFYGLHVAYSFYLKNLMLLDILVIAAGFLIRVFAGEVATGFHISIWLFLTVVSAALFLAIGKRRSELTLLSGWEGGTLTAKTRTTLSHYSEKMLDVYISMFANSTWITYAFYTFLEKPPVFRAALGSVIEDYDLNFLQERKILMITIPLVIYGVMRYLQIMYEKNVGESPEKVLLTDRPILVTVALLGLTLFTIIYVIGK